MAKFDFDISELNNLKRYNDVFPSLLIKDVADFDKPKDQSIYFINNEKSLSLNSVEISNSLILCKNSNNFDNFGNNNFIYQCENPRLEYAIILNEIIKKNPSKNYKVMQNTSVVGEYAFIGENTIIEPGAFIDEYVEIGSHCLIQSGAKIYSGVKIGNNTIIGANSTVGLSGFGLESDENGKSYRIPHLGGVVIGDNVNVSSLCNIHAGTIKPTILDNNVQLDSMVHIAHNCHLMEGVFVAACAEISGSVRIHEKTFIGPNSAIINKISIGSNSIVGIGATVTKKFPDKSVIAGNPADFTYNLAKKSKVLKKLLQTRINKDVDE